MIREGNGHGDRQVYPTFRAEGLAAFRFERSMGAESTYVSGGSLLGIQWESGLSRIPMHLISLEGIAALQGMRVLENAGSRVRFRIGNMIRLAECRRQPRSQGAGRVISTPSIRNIGTLGGDVASAIAAVAAERMEIAEQALHLIEVAYEPLPVLDDPEAALRPDAPRLHASGNVLHRTSYQRGEVSGPLRVRPRRLEAASDEDCHAYRR